MVDFIFDPNIEHGGILFSYFSPFVDGTVDDCFVATTDGGSVDEGEMDNIELVFDGAGVVGFPMIDDFTIAKVIGEVGEEGRGRGWFLVSPEDKDKIVVFMGGIGLNIHVFEGWCFFSKGWNFYTFAIFVKFKSMKRTGDGFGRLFAQAEGGATMGTKVSHADYFSRFFTPKDHSFPHAFDAEGFVFFDLLAV